MENDTDNDNKMQEFIYYLDLNGTEIPSQDSDVCFSDGTKMGNFFSKQEKKINYWLNHGDIKSYPNAYRKLYYAMRKLKVQRFLELELLKQELLDNTSNDKVKTK